MRFFRKKDKKDKTPEPAGLPGFGAGSNGKQHGGGHRGTRSFGASPQYPGTPSFGGTAGAAAGSQFRPMATGRSATALMNLPPAILGKIFAFVCPQSTDESYETCEQSALEDTCMLCDLRDLAHCTAVCKTWRASALNLLYHSIRLDTVHYCDREAYLSDMRKRGSFLNRNADPEDATQARLKLLCRTLREDPTRLGTRVEFFKTPYMLREANQADLARTIAVLPNLKYVDLPEGMYMDDPSCVTLRLEVQARCREIRKMTYMGGAERSLQELAYGTVFTKLEVLELIKINIDPSILRQVLHGLRNIRALKVTETKNFTDEMFYWNDMMVPVPALEELVLNEVPNVTAEGLSQWLMSSPDASNTLKVLSLKHTGVEPWTLYQISTLAPALKNLSITRSVSSALSTAIGGQQAPLLTSKSLEVLHYEIFSTVSVTAASTTASYYNHLASSLLSGGLPNLRAVYVRDPNFPDTLLGLPPPMPGFADGAFRRPSSSGSNASFGSHPSNGYGHMQPQSLLSPTQSRQSAFPPSSPVPAPQKLHSPYGSPTNHGSSPNNRLTIGHPSHQRQMSGASVQLPVPQINTSRFSSNNPFAAMVSQQEQSITNLPPLLEVFTKASNDMQWSFMPMPVVKRRKESTSSRPLSSYGLGADVLGGSKMGWSHGTGARRSVLVSGTGGHFLELPTADTPARGRRGGSIASLASSPGGRSPFLGVPGQRVDEDEVEEWPRPKTSDGERKKEKLDLWR
ncbi:hypothetical protein DL546_003999 [Coniochaeta pulveracea]|uniref:Uncharacterized protein n=1 Tax=Coniochaeta pulveracea TaxID=177199 RepID=A0A420XYK3_9PEZI|nr:hypothetical protein DL546_003999 [Coniochaeta pulveracea]